MVPCGRPRAKGFDGLSRDKPQISNELVSHIRTNPARCAYLLLEGIELHTSCFLSGKGVGAAARRGQGTVPSFVARRLAEACQNTVLRLSLSALELGVLWLAVYLPHAESLPPPQSQATLDPSARSIFYLRVSLSDDSCTISRAL